MMLLSALVLCLSLVHVTAHVTNGSVTAVASSRDQSQSQIDISGTEQGQQKIVINSASTKIQVVPNGQSFESDRELSGIRAELSAMEARIERLAAHKSNAAVGSVYVRWGGRTCPDSAETLYSGVIGGSLYLHKGAAANALCLPLNPVYDGHPLPQWGFAHLYGAEYEVLPEPKNEQDPVCSVCVSPRPHTVMIPATNTCHPGWTVEYTGYIMAGYYDHPAATEYICMDASQDARVGSHADHNGKVFYYTVGKCGSLPCPPYEHNKIITCVVCSK